jgi:tRNA threonylcarbamoyladenosine biosynthesis protein TsaB
VRVLVLALDTSVDVAVCLVDAPDSEPSGPVTVLAERRVAEQRRHAELLAPLITEVLAEAGVDRRDLGVVVVGTGPAPFTGLRAGLVTARTLAFALGVPVHGVCSLDGWAAQAYDAGLTGEVLVVTDARRRELYTARYRRRADDGVPGGLPAEVDLLSGPQVALPTAHGQEPSTATAAVDGPGADAYPEHLTRAPGGPRHLDPAVLARLARRRAAAGLDLPVEPLYLRRPDVTPSVGHKRATG